MVGFLLFIFFSVRNFVSILKCNSFLSLNMHPNCVFTVHRQTMCIYLVLGGFHFCAHVYPVGDGRFTVRCIQTHTIWLRSTTGLAQVMFDTVQLAQARNN